MAIKLKDGHTYITRSGLKRVVRTRTVPPGRIQDFLYCFESAPPSPDTSPFTHTANGRFHAEFKTKWDFVKEFKSNAR